MDYDRLRGVLVAQQKGVPNERLAGLVSSESGRRVGFESHRIYLTPYENILEAFVTVSKQGSKSSPTSVFLYGDVV